MFARGTDAHAPPPPPPLARTSTPMVLLLSRLNSFFVKRVSRLLLPTPLSPISTTARGGKREVSECGARETRAARASLAADRPPSYPLLKR